MSHVPRPKCASSAFHGPSSGACGCVLDVTSRAVFLTLASRLSNTANTQLRHRSDSSHETCTNKAGPKRRGCLVFLEPQAPTWSGGGRSTGAGTRSVSALRHHHVLLVDGHEAGEEGLEVEDRLLARLEPVLVDCGVV